MPLSYQQVLHGPFSCEVFRTLNRGTEIWLVRVTGRGEYKQDCGLSFLFAALRRAMKPLGLHVSPCAIESRTQEPEHKPKLDTSPKAH